MRAFIIAAAFALSACATAAPIPINQPAQRPFAAAPLDLDGDVVALALSGGGARAAAFSLGALEGLREMHAADGRTLLDHVRLVSGVSGGSITAAYFGLHGAAGVDAFRAAYLDKNWAGQLHTNPLSPLDWSRAIQGGLNGPDLLADWLDREVFGHAAMAALWDGAGPQVWINAADLYNGTPFAFAPLYFDAICSDLAGLRVADAVAASMAVPVAFKPILIEPRDAHCAPPPAWAATAATDRTQAALVRRTADAFATYRDRAVLPYLHLVDGGTIDNLGLSTLTLARLTATAPYGPLAPRDAVRMRRFTMLVVNAEKIRTPAWSRTPRGPSGAQAFDAYLDMTIEVENREAYDAFRAVLADWQRDLITWRCSLSNDEVTRLRGSLEGWNCRDLVLAADMISFRDLGPAEQAAIGAAPTRVTLPRALTDALIAGGREAVTHNALALSMTRPN